ncbi:hypothetical protein [Clostridium sp.]|uniref:hypothetical protein n=1 Tax=Clostridium sp. TaxID=1506 RepID=UPI0028FE417A|nr:hypothetical protein [Clostridium sp.]MDU1032553.1 hypothetical protein [Clostridium sp.]
MKNWSKLIKLAYLFIFIFLVYISYKGGLDFDIIAENQFNIITVNTVFAGFLFTSLGIVAGFSNNSSIRKFERIDTMDKIYNNILKGIIFSIVSIVIGIVIAIINFENIIKNTLIYNTLKSTSYICELFFLIMAIIYFCLSVKHTFFAISVVRMEIKSKLPNQKKVKEVLEKIK